ncbi:uncharacterized protein LOC121745110 [Salvia splendens]|uniref:uncharacterized protein LOC121745110 n=1 Tax=Salvia splendens TaxID=180675 RepID=UPI001C273BE2|nr:uncharacterized protein LOC121745110 [Salvia splendens]
MPSNLSFPRARGLNQNICKYVVIYLVCVTYILVSSQPKWRRRGDPRSSTNISHLVFGITSSSNRWRDKRDYIQAWWRPNVSRGFVFLERPPTEHLPWPATHPPYRVSDDNSRYKEYNRHRIPSAIRMARVIEETFKAERGGEARWYVMTDDDTVLFVDNLIGVLSKYDHKKYFYVGMNSECFVCNVVHSFGMAFGGGGYALSYPLAKAVAENMDLCLKRYPFLYGSDLILQSCIADLGVSLTQEPGFHQIDFTVDISGLLSAHPHSPLVSLHHLDAVEPLFPSTNRTESLKLLMEAATLDESRLLQQSICYLKKYNWTLSAAWGYSVELYETILPPSHLYRPRETFAQWMKGASPPYMFNARPLSTDPCDAPHLFFLVPGPGRVTAYRRTSPRGLPVCRGGRSADNVTVIRILSPLKRLDWKQDGGRRECCDVDEVDADALQVKLRDCGANELLL